MSNNSDSLNNSITDSWTPSFGPWIIAVSVMLATFMEVLDTTVANVSLPHIAGSLSASNEEATWVLTSYLVSNAIILPATGWLSGLFGRKKFFIICIFIFTFASFLCGVSSSLGMLVVARILQGIGGGALQPISQAILLESFPPSKRGLATAIFGLGVIFAPIVGPTLGGWITDNLSWHWVFFINIPVGLIAIIMSYMFVEDPPYVRAGKSKSIDFIGLSLMAVGIAALQIMLDKGQQLEWFSSNFITVFAIISAICLISFIVWELFAKDPIVDFKVFKDRNFSIGMILITFVGAVLYGTLALLPLFMQTLLGYSAELSGLAISPRGIGSFLVIMMLARIITKVDNRFLTAIGFGLLAYSCHLLGNLNLGISMNNVIFPNIMNGAALGFIFIPLTSLAFGTLKNQEIGNATGLFNLMRNIGGSIGISLVSTYLMNNSQVHQTNLVAHLTPYNTIFTERISSLANFFSMTSGSHEGLVQANGSIYRSLIQQSTLMSFMDNFRMFSIISLMLIPLIFFFKKVAKSSDDTVIH